MVESSKKAHERRFYCEEVKGELVVSRTAGPTGKEEAQMKAKEVVEGLHRRGMR